MSAVYESLQVYKSAKDMVVYFETIVKGFDRYNKFRIGDDIRRFAYEVLFLVAEANTKTIREIKLRETLDKLLRLKIVLQVCSDLAVFKHPNNYPTASQKVINVSKQCEGWLKNCQNSGKQNLTGSVRT